MRLTTLPSLSSGDLAPHHGQPLIGAFLQGTRDTDSVVRTSSLSNLGELCQRLHFSLGPLAQEVRGGTINSQPIRQPVNDN